MLEKAGREGLAGGVSKSAFLSCGCMRRRARGLGEPCDLTRARFRQVLCERRDCNEPHSDHKKVNIDRNKGCLPTASSSY